MFLSKKLQFFPNHYENLLKYGTNENLILTKFSNDWAKFLDFFMCTFFCTRPYYHVQDMPRLNELLFYNSALYYSAGAKASLFCLSKSIRVSY